MEASTLRDKPEYHEEDKKKKKEMVPSTSRVKETNSNMDEMTKIFKNLFEKK